MSGEHVTNTLVETHNTEGTLHSSEDYSSKIKNRVDINILLKK